MQLLRPLDGGEYVLSIQFENQALQQKWVATDLHTQVWSQMEANFEGYSVTKYDTGMWYYHVRGIDQNLPAGARAMAWSRPIAVRVTGNRIAVVR